MRATLLYRITAGLLLFFALSHTFGFSQHDPSWGADLLISAMHSVRFDMLGSKRSYWDFFMAAGLSAGTLYFFSAILAWQLASLTADVRAKLGSLVWAFGLAYAVVAIVSMRYLFVIPIAFSSAIAICLLMAAARVAGESREA